LSSEIYILARWRGFTPLRKVTDEGGKRMETTRNQVIETNYACL
jgi:hypothetical protein